MPWIGKKVKMYNLTIEPNFNPDVLEENVEYDFCILLEEKTVADGYFSISGFELTYVIIHRELDYMEQLCDFLYEYVDNYMSFIVESISE